MITLTSILTMSIEKQIKDTTALVQKAIKSKKKELAKKDESGKLKTVAREDFLLAITAVNSVIEKIELAGYDDADLLVMIKNMKSSIRDFSVVK
jgi:uncharacterized tellurite resistance protein B-like protein